SPSKAIPVEIEPSETIGDLRDAIKKKKVVEFKDVDAKSLTLWKVSYQVTYNMQEPVSLEEIASPIKLSYVFAEISEVFAETSPKKTIHVIVQRPDPQGSERDMSC
ncbi:hypothetical protein BGW41_006585, partial [Actinomortierella wolfii]